MANLVVFGVHVGGVSLPPKNKIHPRELTTTWVFSVEGLWGGWLNPPESGNFPMSQDEIIRNLMKSLKRKHNGYSCYTVVKVDG